MDPLWRIGSLAMQRLLMLGTALQGEQVHSTVLEVRPEGRTSHVLQREQGRSTVWEVGPEGRTSHGRENSSHGTHAGGAIAALLCLLLCWHMRRTQLEVELGGHTLAGGDPGDAVVAGVGHCPPEGARPQHCAGGGARGPRQPWLRGKAWLQAASASARGCRMRLQQN